MKAKKIITGLTAAALSTAILSSCSEAELMYLDFTKETANWNVFTGTGEMVIELNNETLADFISYVSGDTSVSASDIPFERLSMVYTASADYDNSIYDIDLDIAVDDNVPYTLNFYVDTEKVIFDKSVLGSVRQFLDDYDITDTNISYILDFTDEYFKDYDSIEIPFEFDNADMGFQNAKMSRELIKAVTDFMVTAFDGYETSSYELNGENGVKAVFNYDNVVSAISDLFEYYINNSDKINAAWNDFTVEFSEIMNNMYPNEADNSDLSEQLKLPTVDEVKEMQAQFNSLVNDKSFDPLKDLLMNSEYGFYVEKVSDTSYNSNSYIDLNYKGNDLADITATETDNKLDQLEKKDYNSYVLSYENETIIDEDFDKWLDENHPVKSANITWNKGDEYCFISYIRDESYIDRSYAMLINIDDYIYVPMRKLVEGMGYSVEWDEQNKKAYVMNGNDRFDMTTVMIGDITFIKVRDLEKMGLRVDYQEDGTGTGMIQCTASLDKAA